MEVVQLVQMQAAAHSRAAENMTRESGVGDHSSGHGLFCDSMYFAAPAAASLLLLGGSHPKQVYSAAQILHREFFRMKGIECDPMPLNCDSSCDWRGAPSDLPESSFIASANYGMLL